MKVHVGYEGEWPTTETNMVRLTIGTVEFRITAESNAANLETGRLKILRIDRDSMLPITITPVMGNKVILA